MFYRSLEDFELAEKLAAEKFLSAKNQAKYETYVALCEQYRQSHPEPTSELSLQIEKTDIFLDHPDLEPAMIALGQYMTQILLSGSDGASAPSALQRN